MTSPQTPDVVAFRIQRLRNAPRNWCYWVAAFTAVNGLFSVAQSNIVIPAGLIFPYAVRGIWLHFVAAIVLVTVGYFGRSRQALFGIALVLYVIDAALAAYLRLWIGVSMHIVVLAFVGMALNGVRVLQKQLLSAQQAPASDART